MGRAAVPARRVFSVALSEMQKKWGRKFSDASLYPEYIKYYESQERIEVAFKYGDTTVVKRGRLGITTGWCPVFILLLTTRSQGSSWVIERSTEIRRVCT